MASMIARPCRLIGRSRVCAMDEMPIPPKKQMLMNAISKESPS